MENSPFYFALTQQFSLGREDLGKIHENDMAFSRKLDR